MRMLTFDIETRPHVGAIWGKWEQDVIWWERYGGVISIAWKWSDEKKAHCLSLPDYPHYEVGKEDDKQLLIDFSKLANDADVWIYQNGDRFDLPTINARLLFHRLPPLRPHGVREVIDTLKKFRRHFKFPANNLDEVCQYLGIGSKLRTDKNLWKDCLNPNLTEQQRMRAWNYMKKYNIHDVELTEEVCKRILPFTDTSPNYNVYNNTIVRCPNPFCGKSKLRFAKERHSATGTYPQFQCENCWKYTSAPHVSSNVLRK